MQELGGFLRGHFRRIAAVFVGKLLTQPREKRQDVFTALAQWRHCDLEGREAIEEVWTQHILARLVLLLQVTNRHDARLCW